MDTQNKSTCLRIYKQHKIRYNVFRKMVMITMRDNKRDTDVQNSLLDSEGEGEGGMIWENGIETCIISYMK